MKRNRTAVAIVAALFATTSLTTGIAMAEQANGAATAAANQTQTASAATDQTADQGQGGQADQQMLKVSKDASYGMQEVQMARLALRNDGADQAKSLLQDAKTRFQTASADAVTPDTLKSEAGSGTIHGFDKLSDSSYFAVGRDVMISESLRPQQSSGAGQDQKTADAGEQGQSGTMPSDGTKTADATQTNGAATPSDETTQTADASQARQDGQRVIFDVDEVDMTEVATLLPHDATVKAIDQALSDIDGGDLQKAERTLASVSDNIVFATLQMRGTPNGAAQDQQDGNTGTQPSKS